MAEQNTIAKPYAKALFESALEKSGKYAHAWEPALFIAASIVQDDVFSQAVQNPKQSMPALIELMVDIINEADAATAKVIGLDKLKHFFTMLCSAGRLTMLPALANEYSRLLAEHDGEMQVHVTSAVQLNKAQKTNLLARLKKRFNCKVSADFGLDEQLLGGIKIQAGDWVLDNSIMGKFSRLNEELI